MGYNYFREFTVLKPRNVRTVFLLEDDVPSQSAFRAVLKSTGFQVRSADTAEAAIQYCTQEREPVDLLIADIRLPRMSGVAAAFRIRATRPEMPILFTSGTPIEYCSEADRTTLAEMPPGSYSFLQKPFQYQVLLDSVEGLLTGAGGRRRRLEPRRARRRSLPVRPPAPRLRAPR